MLATRTLKGLNIVDIGRSHSFIPAREIDGDCCAESHFHIRQLTFSTTLHMTAAVSGAEGVIQNAIHQCE